MLNRCNFSPLRSPHFCFCFFFEIWTSTTCDRASIKAPPAIAKDALIVWPVVARSVAALWGASSHCYPDACIA